MLQSRLYGRGGRAATRRSVGRRAVHLRLVSWTGIWVLDGDRTKAGGSRESISGLDRRFCWGTIPAPEVAGDPAGT